MHLECFKQRKKEQTSKRERLIKPQPIDEFKLTEADKLQIRNEGIQLGCLLVQKTKGETQLQVTRWLQTTNAWEAWRQLNLQCTTSRWSITFQLLTSIMNTSFETQPASFLQQLNAWKERVVSYQQLSGEQLPDSIKLLAVVNGLKSSVKSFVLLHLDRDSSFSDLDSVLASYGDIDQHESNLESLGDRACRDKPASIGKVNDRESNPNLEQQLEQGGHREGKGKDKGKPHKGEGEAYPPQPPAYKGKGKHVQLPTRQRWCSICKKRGHKTQACWWNSTDQQLRLQHQQHQAWHRPSTPRQLTEAASTQRSQPQFYNLDQQTAYTSMIPDTQHMLSFEIPSQASTSVVYPTPASTIAQLDSFANASSDQASWGILVDTGAATSVAPKSFASDIELSPVPATLQLTTASGEALKIYGLRRVHLQSRGLSFEVNFVIADVVTPLLGLEIMIKDSLSLNIDHDSQHFLVNPAGDKTKLEYIGRHLYMIACPSQHSLSPCFFRSLSQVRGFLPADKDLHEQRLASRSSSSLALDEDISSQQVDQDSLNFQCQHVSLDNSDAFSLERVHGNGKAADSGGEPKVSFDPKYLQQPTPPSAHDRELHNMTHIPSQPWCVVCQEAKAQASQKRASNQDTRELQPRLQPFSLLMLAFTSIKTKSHQSSCFGLRA